MKPKNSLDSSEDSAKWKWKKKKTCSRHRDHKGYKLLLRHADTELLLKTDTGFLFCYCFLSSTRYGMCDDFSFECVSNEHFMPQSISYCFFFFLHVDANWDTKFI